MNDVELFRVLRFGTIASRLVGALAVASLTACGAQSEAPSAATDGSKAGAPELISGAPAGVDQFRATVGINDDCTAAKVGARLFLTAAHCVAVGRAIHGMPPPDDYPTNDGLREDYLPGKRLPIYWGLEANDGKKGEFVIARTSIHPSWWSCPLCSNAILDSAAADIAVIELGEDTPQIPEARVELAKIATGTRVVKVGWGCEERTNVDASELHLGRYKLASASIIPVSEIRRYDGRISDEQEAAVGASYLVTAGHAKDAQSASLCLGDSGGPLYLSDSNDPKIVGVNSDYSFKPAEDETDKGGVSWADWHTRTSLSSGNGIGEWLKSLQVNTVGG
jgi:trypsin